MSEFLKYQSQCPFTKFGIKDGDLSEFELTCRRKDNSPPGHSLGICDEKHCPEFGKEIKMRDIVIRNTIKAPKVVAKIRICGGGLTFTITDDMQFELPTEEQRENLKKTFGIEVELVEED